MRYQVARVDKKETVICAFFELLTDAVSAAAEMADKDPSNSAWEVYEKGTTTPLTSFRRDHNQ